MGKYRKKPVVIEARRFLCGGTCAQELISDWCNGKLRGYSLPLEQRVIQIDTLEGEMEAKHGDWIIEGVKGEFYPCRADIFDMTYEPA